MFVCVFAWFNCIFYSLNTTTSMSLNYLHKITHPWKDWSIQLEKSLYWSGIILIITLYHNQQSKKTKMSMRLKFETLMGLTEDKTSVAKNFKRLIIRRIIMQTFIRRLILHKWRRYLICCINNNKSILQKGSRTIVDNRSA